MNRCKKNVNNINIAIKLNGKYWTKPPNIIIGFGAESIFHFMEKNEVNTHTTFRSKCILIGHAILLVLYSPSLPRHSSSSWMHFYNVALLGDNNNIYDYFQWFECFQRLNQSSMTTTTVTANFNDGSQCYIGRELKCILVVILNAFPCCKWYSFVPLFVFIFIIIVVATDAYSLKSKEWFVWYYYFQS